MRNITRRQKIATAAITIALLGSAGGGGYAYHSHQVELRAIADGCAKIVADYDHARSEYNNTVGALSETIRGFDADELLSADEAYKSTKADVSVYVTKNGDMPACVSREDIDSISRSVASLNDENVSLSAKAASFKDSMSKKSTELKEAAEKKKAEEEVRKAEEEKKAAEEAARVSASSRSGFASGSTRSNGSASTVPRGSGGSSSTGSRAGSGSSSSGSSAVPSFDKSQLYGADDNPHAPCVPGTVMHTNFGEARC